MMIARRVLRPLSLIVCVAAAACGKAPAATMPDMGPWSAAYAVAVTLQANTPQATTLLFTVPSLQKATTVDYGKAISIPDTASLFGIEGSGAVYATTAMAPNVTRYDVDSSGTITPGTVLSFAQFGLGATYSTRSIAFVSPHKAYLLDDSSLQAIIFDPSTMTVGKAIDLGALKKDGYHTNFSYNVLERSGQLIAAAFYYDASYSRTLGETAVALIDTAADTATVLHDTRCGAFSTAAALPNGDLYFGSDTYSVAIHRIGGDAAAAPGCLLRMKAGEDVLDASFFVHVADVTGGLPGGAAVPGEGNTLWLRAFDETLFHVDATTSGLSILAAPAWRWYKLDPSNPATATASRFAPGAGEVKYFTVGGHAYAGNPSADYSTAAVLDLSTADAPLEALTVKGQPSGIVKAR
jgi:hypothetical protein